MTQRSSVFDLSRQLLGCGDRALLDVSLEALSDRLVPEDEAAAELLRDLSASGIAATLRDALEDDRLDRWVGETCTQREEETLSCLLARWLGAGRHGDDDPARLATIAPLPEGSDNAAISRWAAANDVDDLLRERATMHLTVRAELAGELSLGECAAGVTAADSGSPLAASELRQRAIEYLRDKAADRAAERARAALWQRALVPTLRLLAERLHALADASSARELAAIRFIPARPVGLDPEIGTATAWLLGDDGAPIAVRLHLSGYEHRALASRCDRCPAANCVHAQALAARLLDALHAQDDRLHAALRELTERPSWQRFVHALSRTPDAEPNCERDGHLSFRLRIEGGAISVGVLLHKPSRHGNSPGKLIAPLRAARLRAVDERDRPLLEALGASTRTFHPQYLPADLAILRALVEAPNVCLGDEATTLRLVEQSLHVQLIEQPEGLSPRVTLAGFAIAPSEPNARASYLFQHDRALQTLFFAPLTPPLRRLLRALEHFHGLLPPESHGALASWLPSIRRVAQLSVPTSLQHEELLVPNRLLLRITPNIGVGIEVALASRPLPLGALWPPAQGPELVHGLLEGRQVSARRDIAWERQSARSISEALALARHPQLRPFEHRIDDEQAALELLSRAATLTDVLDLEWAETKPRLAIQASLRTANLSIRMFKRAGHWLTVEGAARDRDAHVSLDRLLEAARRGERFVRIADGSYAEIERELFERLERAQLCVHELTPSAIALSSVSARYWQDALGAETEATRDVRAWLARAVAYDPKDAPPIAERWRAILRDYQIAGVRFLMHMSSWAPGACLADEMGLGKTLQAIALLESRAELGPALVLAPTSVVSNWASELARFAPAFEVIVYRGSERERALERLGPHTILISSYELLQRDEARFAARSFATQVLDEAHLIKNANTGRARAARAVQADFRLALSGTPIENRLGDLWSLMLGIAPGLLGDWSRFRALFAVPIERYGNRDRAEALRKLVSPFILRRTKDDVARELPARTEVVHRVALSEPERALYQAAEREIKLALDKRRIEERRTVQILAELTRLRQLACHPRLVLDESDAESSKLAVLMRLLEDILPRGHRALLFSQFTRHLALVREALDARAIDYLYLDGSTPAVQRAGLVERFQRGEAPLFLISLKAGGTGLNLTAADYVVHLDPWWNPAAEDQASDRAHRLGQRKPVTVIKLVAEDTIEEKVLALHGHKRELADAIMQDRAAPARIDLEVLQSLLPP